LGTIGIGHTRWATHGIPSEANAHPHIGGNGVVALAHNGVIENYQVLKQKLQAEGYLFSSSTDTEAVAHLVASSLEEVEARRAEFPAEEPRALLLAAVTKTLSQLRGTYGLVMLFRDYPGVVVAARLGSPLDVGVGKGEHFSASDASPLAGRTDKISVASPRSTLTPRRFSISGGSTTSRPPSKARSNSKKSVASMRKAILPPK
jgi:glutamine---fructose-6-phosphate transaminase (isomerizing)